MTKKAKNSKPIVNTDCFFLGPKSEQRSFLQKSISLILNEYIFWRRNYHPKDPPAIELKTLTGPGGQDYQDKFLKELVHLMADLKQDLPFFSPRYFAHLLGEINLPSITAYFATLLYNPNNVSNESSSITLEHELEVGNQFADLFGFPVEKSFGHITSGGTVANYESIFYHQAAKFIPLTLAMHLKDRKLPWLATLPKNYWSLLNFPVEKIDKLYVKFLKHLKTSGDIRDLDQYKISHLGHVGYFQKAQEVFETKINTPVILIPKTAHYSWKRAASLFGLGKNSFLGVDVDEKYCMCPKGLEKTLQHCLKNKIPVIQCVFVLGTTEFGNFDPLHKLIPIVQKYRTKGLYFPCHLDAAYGGYFATLMKKAPKSLSGKTGETKFLAYLKDVFSFTKKCDSVTIDPHKLGFCVYGSGSIVFKHGFLKEFITESAPYVEGDSSTLNLNLSQYILEGSKPGAAASSVWFSHKMIPLEWQGYGQYLFKLCQTCYKFYLHVKKQNQILQKTKSKIRIKPLYEPQSNVLCLCVFATNKTSYDEVNKLNSHLHKRFSVKKVDSIQSYDYLLSHTQLHQLPTSLKKEKTLSNLSVSESQPLTILRIVFGNLWVNGKTHEGVPYLKDFTSKLISEAEDYTKSLN